MIQDMMILRRHVMGCVLDYQAVDWLAIFVMHLLYKNYFKQNLDHLCLDDEYNL